MGAEVNTAIENRFSEAGIAYRTFYMDAKRNSDFAWKLKSAQLARRLIDEYAPQVLVAIDDVAQGYVARHYVGNSTIQIVFAGVNADPVLATQATMRSAVWSVPIQIKSSTCFS